ncbi:RNA polymerase sigma factor [Paucibacter sp. APW11]|uniref:RNA polymerase sigma factor n=1 Tax=Roseateles aquae TaxID=3077235 RepID=A0ABU3PI32_9BURK|nr:RNA polymerase sigma factor [Paucibacter sp. APW11]MDT9001651.1 RNA polymerase sigma factor [Paucibacter sp. APW11]
MGDSEAADGSIDAGQTTPMASESDLAALYPEWYPRLYRYFRANGCLQSVAHELVQDSFAAALRGLAGYRGDALLSTWLWAIGKRVLLAHWRHQQLPEVSDEAAQSRAELISFEASHLSVQDDCVRRGFARFAQQHPEQAEALYLAYVEGWSHADLGQKLGRSEHAATVYLADCRAKLQPFLRDCNDC